MEQINLHISARHKEAINRIFKKENSGKVRGANKWAAKVFERAIEAELQRRYMDLPLAGLDEAEEVLKSA